MTDRPSLSQLAAQSQGDPLKNGCPTCGCLDWRHAEVTTTRKIPKDGKILRYRRCRHCGFSFPSYEVLDPGSPTSRTSDGEPLAD